MNVAYLAPLIGLVVALAILGGALLLIRRPIARPPGPTPDVPAGRRVVVVGGGFGGLQAVHKLRRADVDVTLIDRRNFHLFQPLVYQVATGALSPGEIAAPLRSVFSRARNVRVLLGEVASVDLARRVVVLAPPVEELPPVEVPYDTLIVAAGSKYSYFGHDEWAEFAPEVKSLESALDVRHRILAAFEAAELESDPERRASWLTFAVVGAGPTGVEMAGQIAELARDTLPRDFRAMDPSTGRILLVEAGPRVLAGFPADLSESAEHQLEHLGVTTMIDSLVVGVDDEGIELEHPGGARERVGARTVVWAAGVAAASLAGRLASAAGAEVDRAGRITVEPDLTLRGYPEVLALGDMARVRSADGGIQDLPGVAPVAMQQGRYAARVVKRRLAGKEVAPFKYVDKGNLATIGRARAVADIKRVHFGGPLAWLLWLGIHIFYLIGFQNRLLVLLRWSFSFMTRGRGARLITGEGAPSRVRVLDVALRVRGRSLDRDRPRRVDREPAGEHRRQRRGLRAGGAQRHRGDLGAQQPLPRGAADRRARHADLALPPQPRAVREAAQHGAGDVADRDADLRAVPGRAPAARRHRDARHDHAGRRRAARLVADDVLLQPARRGPQPARRLRARRRRRARRFVPQPCGEGGRVVVGAAHRPRRRRHRQPLRVRHRRRPGRHRRRLRRRQRRRPPLRRPPPVAPPGAAGPEPGARRRLANAGRG
jgi:NADH dehydrogenase